MSAQAIRALSLCALSCAMLDCAAPFPAPNIVDRPRIIAVRASPIVAMAGQTLEAQVAFGGADSLVVRTWRVCVPARIDPFPEQRCADGEGAVAYTQEGGQTLRWQIPTDQGQLTMLLFAAFVDANGNVPNVTTALNQLRANGAEMLVYVEAQAPDGTIVRAVKRTLFAIAPIRFAPLTALRFRFAGQRFEARDGQCVPLEGGDPVSVAAGSRAIVAIEPPAIDVSLDGAHYATGGSFPSVFEIAGITDWVAPATAGVTVRHWVVVQSNVQRSSGARVSDVLFCSFQTRTE